MLELTELIDKYLLGELSVEDLKAFEDRLKADANLRNEVELQRDILKGIELASIHKQINTAHKKYFIQSAIIKTVVGLLLVAGISSLTYLFTKSLNKDAENPATSGLNNDADKIQGFKIDNNNDTIIETRNGMVFVIPAKAFDTDSDSIEIKIEEALDAASIIMKGLSTVSDSALLETAGMFKFSATVNNNEVKMIKEILTSLPTDKVDKDMMLFKGKEDGKGNINWVNPKKLQKELITYDIEKLNFFPPQFLDIIDTLYEIKGINTESKNIYFEMSGYRGKSGILIDEKFNANHTITLDVQKKPGSNNYEFSNDKKKITGQVSGINYTFYGSVREINPSRIRAIWDKKFNKTILATKEFEERLQYIFSTCNPAYLDLYINNLDKPLFYIDSMCATMAEGFEKTRFQMFQNRKDGGVNINNQTMTKLREYYEKKQSVYRAASEKTWKEYYEKIRKEDEQFATRSSMKSIEESARQSTVFKEELCKNLTNAYAQIGQNHNCYNNTPQRQAYIFTIANTGWYNLDKYVNEATTKRESLNYTDQLSGKKAIIEYAKCFITIKDFAAFDILNGYLLPEELSTYQRLKKIDDRFTENLNMSFNNNIVVVAKKGNDWYWSSFTKAEGKAYSLVLKKINEQVLKHELNKFDKKKKADIMDDMTYAEYAEAYTKNLKKRKIDAEQKRQIANIIYPCIGNLDETEPYEINRASVNPTK